MAIHDITRPDGRGPRHFIVNGKRINHVFYADTKAGFVDYYPEPFEVDRVNECVVCARLYGTIKVVFE
jgi:hypothetical protein